MLTCPTCGRESERAFAFCPYCGAELVTAPPTLEQRKTVTVLFCDVTGSTALGESTDPEALRALLARYFERMKAVVGSHGGTVEKFIGDAVMAVFGVPQVREDDALRAVRAALEMRDALPELGVQARIGLNTGEVVTGTEERLATGDAVNVAARLEQAAQPGEILIGATTLALVRDGVEAELVEPLELKGKAEPVSAYRLLSIAREPTRRHDAPMIGRGRELQGLRDAFERATSDRSCQLFTVLGPAGVGKSRLAHEFLDEVEARVVRGRCLSYGEGITYRPVTEVLKQLAAVPSDPAAAATLGFLLGENEQGQSPDEIAWAVRKLLEESAADKPLVCVFDDIHWGEETFLDLVEHIADLSRDAPLLLLCLARPELLDKRSSWGGGKLNATSVLLEPLSVEESTLLLEELGGVADELRLKIVGAAEGNPLFVEEMLALVREAENGDVQIPPTIQALLAARLDQLDPSEQHVLQCGAIEGRVFHRGALEALAPQEEQLPQRLVSLVRRELIRPHAAELPGDEAFRFRHLLIRDAAYDALPKATRAELHERFAVWLGEREDLVDLDEIVGFHLERAAKYKTELGQPDQALAERAGARLARAGRRALRPGNDRAAGRFFGRALELTRPFGFDVHLEVDFALTFHWDDPAKSVALSEAAVTRARAVGDERAEILARVVTELHRLFIDPAPDVEGLASLAEEALLVLEEAEDHAGLVHVWIAIGYGVANNRGRMADWAHAAQQCIAHARAAGRWYGDDLGLASALVWGPEPADEALRILDETFPDRSDTVMLFKRAYLLALLARFDEAWALALPAAERSAEIGDDRAAEWLADIAALAGDYEAAAQHGLETVEAIESRGHRAFLSLYASKAGRWLCELGRSDEAETMAVRARDANPIAEEWLWRQVQARVHAARGEHARAEQLARTAVEMAEREDSLTRQGDAVLDLAEVLASAGRLDEAAATLEQALDRYMRKKNFAMVGQVKPRLEALRKAAL